MNDQFKYEVTVRNRHSGNRWTMMFWASNFADAENQAHQYIDADDPSEEIIIIAKEYV